ncbi:MAG: hypothetical protein IH957_09345 [Chloroflexi bacterium]|nr:hypothetical protein [Chloroflexota bacterium]
MRRLLTLTAICFAITVTVAACGSDGDDDGTGAATDDQRSSMLPAIEALVVQQAKHMRDAIDSGSLATDEDGLQDVLPDLILQFEDLPEGLQPLGGSFSTNAESASGLGTGPTKAQLDEWGRILGFAADYQRVDPTDIANVTAINTSISLYATPEGATESFENRIPLAREADWQSSHADLEEFRQEELSPDLGVDDLFWLHLSGFQLIGPDERVIVSDDQIVFLVGQTWGFLGVVSIIP